MRKFVVLLAALGVCIVAVYGWYRFLLRPVAASDTADVIVRIPSGASARQIATVLDERDLIRSPRAFTLHARFSGAQSRLQAGSFVVQRSMSAPEILDALSGEIAADAIITIPEGFTVRDIDELLAERGLTQPGEIERCARECDFSAFTFLPKNTAQLAPRGGRIEGYLFPDTYFVVATDFRAEEFLKRLLETFQERVVEGLREDIAASDRPLHDIVTMASLVEEETRTDEERAIVAGILWKRFDAEMGLGVDAAVRYVLGKPTAAITVADLHVDSPYNLRKFRGLPPGSIANAGIESIRATLHPQPSAYWYYLHDAQGQIHYAETNEEHNRNRLQYLPNGG